MLERTDYSSSIYAAICVSTLFFRNDLKAPSHLEASLAHPAQEANPAAPLGECTPAAAELVGVEMKLKQQIHHLHTHQNHPVVSFSGFLLRSTVYIVTLKANDTL